MADACPDSSASPEAENAGWDALPSCLADFLLKSGFVPKLRSVCKGWCKEWDASVVHVNLVSRKFADKSVKIDEASRLLETKLPGLRSLRFRDFSRDWLGPIARMVGSRLESLELNFVQCQDPESVPYLGNLRRLALHLRWPFANMNRFLVQLTCMGRLTDLSLRWPDLDDEIIGPISFLTQLERLRIEYTKVHTLDFVKPLTKLVEVGAHGCTALTQLSAVSVLIAITKLDLAGTRLDDDQAHFFSRLENLRDVNLGRTWVGDGLLNHLCIATKLTNLDVRGSSITECGLKAMAPLVNLERLDIGKSMHKEMGLTPLTSLRRLKWLDLKDVIVGNEGVHVLTNLQTLTNLTFSIGKITDEGFPLLANLSALEILVVYCDEDDHMQLKNWGCLPSLKDLSFWSSSDAILEHLTRLHELESLCLYGGHVTDVGMSYIATLQGLREFWILNIEGYEVNYDGSDDGIGGLRVLTNLVELCLPYNIMSEECIERLEAAMPFCSLRIDMD